MIQFGLNGGSRNLRVFGIVRNLTRKNFTPYEHLTKDKHILGVFGLMWAVVQAKMPKQITDACETAMELSGIPRMTHDQDTESKKKCILIKKSVLMPFR